MKTSPKDLPLKLPSKTLSGQASPEDPFGALSEYDTCPRSPTETPFGAKLKPCRKPLRSLLRKPLRAFLRRVPRVPEASPEATLRNLLRNPFRNIASESATRPEGKPKDPFEICLMSRKPHRETLRSFPRRVPRIPEYPRPGESLRKP